MYRVFILIPGANVVHRQRQCLCACCTCNSSLSRAHASASCACNIHIQRACAVHVVRACTSFHSCVHMHVDVMLTYMRAFPYRRMLHVQLRVHSSGVGIKRRPSSFKINVLSVKRPSVSTVLHLLGNQKRVSEK